MQGTTGQDLLARVATRTRVKVAPRRIPAQLLMERLADTTTTERTALQRVLGVSPLSAEDWPWYQGVLGEQEVGHELSRLPLGWHVFHSLPIGTGMSDVDHVVVGPQGVFTINAKHHRGGRVWARGMNVRVNGRRQQYVRAAQHEARGVARILADAGVVGVPVRACVAIVGARGVDAKVLPDGIDLAPASQLVRILVSRPASLSEFQADSVCAALERYSASMVPPTQAVKVHWEELHRGERESRSVRRLWSLAGGAALVTGALTLGQGAIALAGALITGLVH